MNNLNCAVYETDHQMGKTTPKIIIFFLLSFFWILGIGLVFLAVFYAILSYYDGSSIIELLIGFVYIISIAVFIFRLGWVFLSQGMARYHFISSGIEVKWPLRSKRLILWSEFQQICICYGAYTTQGEPRASTVICCVKHGEKKNWKGRWKTDNPFRYRSVFTIDYSPELHAGIKERCPYDVVDLRETRAYRLR